jgi:CheY-like chemotaxis protein
VWVVDQTARLSIQVRDTGAGIPQDKQEHIFQLFTQADSSTTRKHGGTGLGLAICRQLASLMGGSIELESEVGVGSTFELVLPLPVGGVSKAPSADTDSTMARRVSGALTGRYRVLLAEDNRVNQLVAERMLSRLGYKTDVAETGMQVLERIESGAYDLILMDGQMPELDGYETTAEIRRREGVGPRIPIVARTANSTTGDREKSLAAGMDDYLSKPITRQSLAGVVSRWLGAPAAS